jgi:hypothetical protein
MKVNEMVKAINELRIKNRNDWYFCTITTADGQRVQVKGYGTWLQKFLINGIDHSNGMGMKVGEYKDYVSSALAQSLKT